MASPSEKSGSSLLPPLRATSLGGMDVSASDEITGLPLSLPLAADKDTGPAPQASPGSAVPRVTREPRVSDGVPDAVPEMLSEPLESSPIITSALPLRPRRARRGDMIGERYIVDGQIGRGGMGRVLRVRHQVLGKAFALKLIKGTIATNIRIREMFYREARLASAVSHDNICTVVDFGQDPNFGLFMVMELLQGETIFDKLQVDGPMPPKAACDVIYQVAEALRYIHSRSIIHGDIKSENILLTRTPDRRRVVKLLDFGLARARDVAETAVSIEGTPEYLAPERIRGQPASQASDIYALGILFHELLAGRMPFTGDMDDVFRMQLEQALPPLSPGGGLDERVDELLARATAKDPKQRHPDVTFFLYELRTLMNMLGIDLGRRRGGSIGAGASTTASKRARSPARRAQGGAEIFEHAPVPLASVDAQGKVRMANQAFAAFLGWKDTNAVVHLSDSSFPDVYPTLFDDLAHVSASRLTLKRIIYLTEESGSMVEVAVILTAIPQSAAVTGGDILLAIHALGRIGSRQAE